MRHRGFLFFVPMGCLLRVSVRRNWQYLDRPLLFVYDFHLDAYLINEVLKLKTTMSQSKDTPFKPT